MKGGNREITTLEQRLERKLLDIEGRVKTDFEEMLKVSTELATEVETFDKNKIDFETSLNTIENIQGAIMKKIPEIIQKETDMERELDETITNLCDSMNEKLLFFESRLALIEKKSNNSDTIITINCNVCGKFFRNSATLERHCQSKHNADK